MSLAYHNGVTLQRLRRSWVPRFIWMARIREKARAKEDAAESAAAVRRRRAWARRARLRDCHRELCPGGALTEGKRLCFVSIPMQHRGFLLHERSKECFFCIVLRACFVE